MIFGLGVPELSLILIIIIVLFGVGRIGKIGGELGSAVKNFREGISKATADDIEPEAEKAK